MKKKWIGYGDKREFPGCHHLILAFELWSQADKYSGSSLDLALEFFVFLGPSIMSPRTILETQAGLGNFWAFFVSLGPQRNPKLLSLSGELPLVPWNLPMISCCLGPDKYVTNHFRHNYPIYHVMARNSYHIQSILVSLPLNFFISQSLDYWLISKTWFFFDTTHLVFLLVYYWTQIIIWARKILAFHFLEIPLTVI